MLSVDEGMNMTYAKIFTNAESFYYESLAESVTLEKRDFIGCKLIVKSSLFADTIQVWFILIFYGKTVIIN